MDSADPLAELADIHLPDPIGFWPPAPGWWVLLVLALVLGFMLYRRYAAQWKQKRICSFALRELDKCVAQFRKANPASAEEVNTAKLNFVSEVNAVLRRVALKHYPEDLPASLGGEQWIAFLRQHGDARLLDETLAHTLIQGRFARQWDVDDEALYRMAHQWITSLYLARIDQGRISAGTETTTATTKAANEHA